MKAKVLIIMTLTPSAISVLLNAHGTGGGQQVRDAAGRPISSLPAPNPWWRSLSSMVSSERFAFRWWGFAQISFPGLAMARCAAACEVDSLRSWQTLLLCFHRVAEYWPWPERLASGSYSGDAPPPAPPPQSRPAPPRLWSRVRNPASDSNSSKPEECFLRPRVV